MPITAFTIPGAGPRDPRVQQPAAEAAAGMRARLIPAAENGGTARYNRADVLPGQNNRVGRTMHSTNQGFNTSLTDAACGNFAMVGRLNTDLGLSQIFDVLEAIVATGQQVPELYAGINYLFRRVTYRTENNRRVEVVERVPSRTAGLLTRPSGINGVGQVGGLAIAPGGMIDAARINALNEAYQAVVNAADPFALEDRDFGSNARGVTQAGVLVFARDARKSAFHRLLAKTIIELFGFTAADGDPGVGDAAIAIRSNDWWSIDHVGILLRVQLDQAANVYAQTVPRSPVHCCCDALWDEGYPETIVKVTHVPAHLMRVLETLELDR